MAIEYVEIRNLAREIVGIIDTAKSIIWHSVYYGVGDFEIYAPATEKHLSLLQRGYYVTRPDDLEVGIIEKIEVSKSVQDGEMIVASGRFAKSLLSKRLIYRLSGNVNKPTVLRGNVETNIRNVVKNNIISCSWNAKRNVSIIELGAVAGITKTIVDESGNPTDKQVSYQNLQEYTDEVLQEYEMASMIVFNEANNKLQYVVYDGADRSVDNVAGNEPIIFSKEFDNLIESNYSIDDSNEKTVALIGGEGEGLQRFYTVVNDNNADLQRNELWVDASSINKKYKDDQDVEHEYTTSQYRSLLKAEGKTKLAEFIQVESFNGTINTANGQWVLNRDFTVGDIVTVQDNRIGIYANVRIVEATEVQDESGYSADLNFLNLITQHISPEANILTENNIPLTTQLGVQLLREEAPTSEGGIKISELDEVEELFEGCCMPIVQNGETKKVTYSTLREQINEEIVEHDPTVPTYVKGITTENISGWNNKINPSDKLTNSEIDELLE